MTEQGHQSVLRLANRSVRQTVRVVARQLAAQGAEAVVLMGSRVRGNAYRESDTDLHAIGRGPHYQLEHLEGSLLSVSFRTVKQVRDRFKTPAEVARLVPAWR